MKHGEATTCLALAELTKQALFWFDVELKQFIYTNPAFHDIVPQTDTLIRTDIESMIHSEDAGFVKASYEELLERGKKDIEFRLLMPDKTIRSVHLEAFVISTAEGRQVIAGNMSDITAIKEHSNILNKFSNKKNSLLNILSHDLLGPLATIQNLSIIIKEKATDLEITKLKQFINSIEKMSRNSIAIIRNLLNQEFLESAGAELVLQRTNIVTALRQSVEQYKQSEETMQKTFNFSTTKDIIMVDIDETKLLQAVNNLISNSLKFTQDNGIIEISVTEEENTVLLIVSDNGIGIPERHHAGLFDKFTSARRTGLHGEASNGLGMSIIKTIIEWHHGEISFISEENKGTTFYIKLPCPN